MSLLSDSNQRPRDWQAVLIASLQPSTLATFPSWGIPRELTVRDLPMLITSVFANAGAKLRFFQQTKKLHFKNLLLFNIG